jgi:hypothetical protein
VSYSAGGGSGNGRTDGGDNTGNGGGSGSGGGGTGGSGIVVLRYADTFALAVSTTGSPTVTTAGGYNVYKFTGSGTITF